MWENTKMFKARNCWERGHLEISGSTVFILHGLNLFVLTMSVFPFSPDEK